ncbi:MAG: zf-HC2 domain-containing protein [Planctomycetes bacterium]|nr:zf-HC2 domain-containing protein [Planctomycetota bacterium]
MTCDDYRSQLHDYFHGSLEPGPQAEVDRHAAECVPCGELMRLAREISCRDFVGFLNEYIDGELAPERRAIFERHLAICSDCTAYLDSYRKTMSLSVAALRDAAPVPAKIPEGLLRAILAARK